MPRWGLVGKRAYDTRRLRSDLDHFAFLPGGSDGEPLFRPGQQQPRPR